MGRKFGDKYDKKKEKALMLLDDGVAPRDVAQHVGVNLRTVYKWNSSLHYEPVLPIPDALLMTHEEKVRDMTDLAIDSLLKGLVWVGELWEMNEEGAREGTTKDRLMALRFLADFIGLSKVNLAVLVQQKITSYSQVLDEQKTFILPGQDDE